MRGRSWPAFTKHVLEQVNKRVTQTMFRHNYEGHRRRAGMIHVCVSPGVHFSALARLHPILVTLPFVLLLFAASCSGHSGARPRPTPFHGPVGSAGPAGPIAEILTAVTLAKDGSPLGPSTDFLPNAPQVTVVVQIGNLAGSGPQDLSVSWFKDKPSGPDEELFTQHIQVTQGARAYATGISPGILMTGEYSVIASLEGKTAAWRWIVTTMSGGTKSRRRLQGSQLELDGNTASWRWMVAASASTRIPRLLEVSQSEPPSVTTATVGPPTSGPSGVVPGDQTQEPPASTSSGGCALSVNPEGGTSGTYATVDATGCTGDSIVVAASGGTGASRQIDHFDGDSIRFESVDPCKIGGSDLPGAKLTYVASVAHGPDAGKSSTATITLGPDVDPPGIVPDSVPMPGAQVFAGDHIVVTLLVSDEPRIGGSGVAEIKATSPQVTLDGGEQSYGAQPAPCDNARRVLQPSFTVPNDPPDVIVVTISTKDFAGNARTIELDYPTKAEWIGIATLKSTSTVPGNSCTMQWLVSLKVFVGGKGAVQGIASASPLGPPRCVKGFVGAAAETFDLKIAGTFDGDAFRLQFFPLQSPGGFESGFHLLYYPGPPKIELPLKSPGRTVDIDVDLSNSGPEELRGGGGTATLKGDMFLGR